MTMYHLIPLPPVHCNQHERNKTGTTRTKKQRREKKNEIIACISQWFVAIACSMACISSVDNHYCTKVNGGQCFLDNNMKEREKIKYQDLSLLRVTKH